MVAIVIMAMCDYFEFERTSEFAFAPHRLTAQKLATMDLELEEKLPQSRHRLAA
jgi:hypothetical protein